MSKFLCIIPFVDKFGKIKAIKEAIKMSDLETHYNNYDEDARLGHKHGQVEFLTTMRYIEKYLAEKPDAYVLEVGAGTGRYSRTIADMGYVVDAVELVPHNIDIFRSQMTPNQKIQVVQGNALDLNMHAENTFDITLLLGPMYHLYTEADKHKAISEALRVTKPGGVIFAAYIISDATILEDGFSRNYAWLHESFAEWKIDPDTIGEIISLENVFEFVRKADIDRLMNAFKAGGRAKYQMARLHYVATDMLSRFLRESLVNMSDEKFDMYLKYHFTLCERPDMVGMTHHSLDIFRKL